MDAATQCETLFNQVDDLGAGVVAIGDLLQFGKDEAYSDTLNGVGIVLRQLGANMRGLNAEFLDKPYKGIRALETEKEQSALTHASNTKGRHLRDVSAAMPSSTEQPIETRLKKLLDSALIFKKKRRPER
jgi:hypothetical protein